VKVQEIVDALGLQVAAGSKGLENEITGGYASDLLSCVMAGAKSGNVWVTLQAHANVVAVCELLGLACVIMTEGTSPHAEALARADEKGVATLLSDESTFTVVGRMTALGIGAQSVNPQGQAPGGA
jgi:serine kinase of HPr protein (carbohydrate metabolism regulator)